jgi:hypothetical protein
LILKDKGRRDYTLTPAPPGPTYGVHFRMSQNPAPVPLSDTEQLEAGTNEAIAACDGDVRAALKAAIVANAYLESELSALQAALSNGYARGKMASGAA